MSKYSAKRISKGHYIYRGYKVYCIGYYPPENRIVWEAVDHDGSGFAHSFSLRDTKMLIDIDLKRKEYDSTRID
jgi:hypothetical protein